MKKKQQTPGDRRDSKRRSALAVDPFLRSRDDHSRIQGCSRILALYKLAISRIPLMRPLATLFFRTFGVLGPLRNAVFEESPAIGHASWQSMNELLGDDRISSYSPRMFRVPAQAGRGPQQPVKEKNSPSGFGSVGLNGWNLYFFEVSNPAPSAASSSTNGVSASTAWLIFVQQSVRS